MRLYINDVAVRDGFQIEKVFVPTATKIEVINQLARTGLHKIEVTSFVSPKAVPALADANDVLAGIDHVPGVVYVALVPNLRGVHNAAAAPRKPDEVNAVISASETHNRANINRTHEQSLGECVDVIVGIGLGPSADRGMPETPAEKRRVTVRLMVDAD